MNFERIKTELIYIVITIVLYLASYYLKLHDMIAIYLLVRIWLRDILDKENRI